MQLTARQLAILRLARTPKIGPVTFRRLCTRYGTPEAVVEAWPTFAKNGHTLSTEESIAAEVAATAKHGGWYLFNGEPAYPAALAALADAPLVLTGLGNPQALAAGPMVGLVGTRTASAGGIKWFEELARNLATYGLTVVSGLARGMDGAAHTGSLSGGGPTVAVVGGGVDQIYPPEHRLLRERILQNGAIVSEQPWGMPIRAELFPRRNRIIAGLSRAVVVAEASRHSGSLITAEYALEYGREVFAVPGNPSDPRAAGPNWLLKNGAHLLETAQDILDNLPPEPAAPHNTPLPLFTPAGKTRATAETTPQALPNDTPQALADYLSPTPTELDDLIRLSGLSEAETTAQLVELELSGHAIRDPDGRWRSL